MLRPSRIAAVLLSAIFAEAQAPAPQAQIPGSPATGARELFVTVGKSLMVDSPVPIQRVSVANGTIAEAVATSPREVLVNGKAPGETSLIIWQQGGQRILFDLEVQRNDRHVQGIQRELNQELQDQKVTVTLEDDTPFVRGTVKDLSSAERALAIASALGAKPPVNLLRVTVPPVEPQILIKVKFADVDRVASRDLGINFASTGAGNTIGEVTTGQFGPFPPPTVSGTTTTFTISDVLNVFLLRRDLNLATTLRALQSRNLLQILAEPNVLSINGHTANFLAGGEFPFPTLQGGGAGLGAVTIQFREFGVRIAFTPTLTPRGTIRMAITPEVSSLDFANGLVFQSFTIPALSTRRVQTAVELEDGQSFVIGGLLDNRVINNLRRIPGLGDIPFFGKLFRSQQLSKNNTELIVVVTPEIVRPIPVGQPVPSLNMPEKLMKPNTAASAPRTPGLSVTGPVPNKPLQESMPVEQLLRAQQKLEQQSQQSTTNYQGAPLVQFAPVPLNQPTQPAPPVTPPVTTPPPVIPPNSGPPPK